MQDIAFLNNAPIYHHILYSVFIFQSQLLKLITVLYSQRTILYEMRQSEHLTHFVLVLLKKGCKIVLSNSIVYRVRGKKNSVQTV